LWVCDLGDKLEAPLGGVRNILPCLCAGDFELDEVDFEHEEPELEPSLRVLGGVVNMLDCLCLRFEPNELEPPLPLFVEVCGLRPMIAKEVRWMYAYVSQSGTG